MKTRMEDYKLQNARCKNSKEKEVIRMKRLIGLGLAILLVCGLSVVSFAAEPTQNVTITVAPDVSAAFTIDPNSFDLGTVGVDVSTGNVSELDILNTGNVTLAFTKTVASITGGWALGAPAKDTCRLKALADASALTPWGSGVTTGEFAALTVYNDLTANNGSTQLTLDKDATQKLWFMLDMPTEFGSGTSQTITVTIKGTSS